jgi:putative DNA primase/helicase
MTNQNTSSNVALVHPNNEYKIAILSSITATDAVNKTVSYETMVNELTKFRAVKKEDAPCIIAGNFINNKRKNDELRDKQLFTLDIDKYDKDISHLEDLLNKELGGYQRIAHSTASHTNKKARARVYLFLSTPVETNKFKTIASNFVKSLSPELQKALDMDASTNPSKLMFMPTKPASGCDPWNSYSRGALIDPSLYERLNDNVIALVKNNIEAHDDPFLFTAKNMPCDFSDEQIQEMLNRYPAELAIWDYYAWLKVGMMLHHQYKGGEKGFELWDEWSKKDTKRYDGLRYLKRKWESFDEKKEPITFRSFRALVERFNTVNDNGDNMTPIPIEWVDFRIVKKVKMPRYTLDNLKLMLEAHNIRIIYDNTKKEKCIYFDGVKASDNNLSCTNIKHLATKYGINNPLIPDALDMLAKYNPINSWKEWIESKPWDGVDRFPAFCDTLEIDTEKINERTRNRWLNRTLLQMIHMSCLNDDPRGKVARNVLILQGPQKKGKTSWIKALVPEDKAEYVLTGQTINLANEMDKVKCSKYPIVECGEFGTTLRKSEMDSIKNYTSADTDVVNRKFQRDHEIIRRSGVLIATINETNFLPDSSGSSRFLIIPVVKCNFKHQIDMQQLYAQLLAYAKQNPDDYHLTEEDYTLAESINESFEEIRDIEELFKDAFDTESTERIFGPLTVSKILTEYLGVPAGVYRNTHMKLLNEVLIKYKCRKSNSKNTGYRGWYLPPTCKDTNSPDFDKMF